MESPDSKKQRKKAVFRKLCHSKEALTAEKKKRKKGKGTRRKST